MKNHLRRLLDFLLSCLENRKLPSIEKTHFKLEMGVRDYELDSYGVINSSVFQNSFEHTHHMFLEASDVKMSDLVRLG